MSIDSLTFVSGSPTSAVMKSRTDLMTVDLSRMQGLPKLLGNTDPLRVMKFLPGVQTVTDFNSNIYIRGCDAAHNDMTVGGVPVFGVNHLLGLFSIFNPSHYPRMSFSPTSSSNRLGGMVDMELPDTLRKKVTGDVSVGMVSTQGTVGVRLGNKSHLRASVRQSYLNLLYSRWMKFDGNEFRYDFGDYNLTWLYSADDKNRIWVDLYAGRDQAFFGAESYGVDFSADWGNYKASLHWRRTGDELIQNHSLFSTGFGSECDLSQMSTHVLLPSYIMANGYKGSFKWKYLTAKAELTHYMDMPQSPVMEGFANTAIAEENRQMGLESVVGVDYQRIFAEKWGVEGGLKGTCFHNPEIKTVWALLPHVSLSYDAYDKGKVSASYGWSQQNLFCTGLSNSGLPMEFWFVAGKYSRPQYSQWADVSYDLRFLRDMFSLSCSLYAKKLYNQVEYHGDLMDLLLTEYELEQRLLEGTGYNFGLNVMLHKQRGRFTGWLSYSLGRALRRFDNPEYSGWYPANHERIHELNCVCAYEYRKWDFSGTFIYASGLPFTAPESYYMSSGQLVAEFGEHNACRMRPYIRLDLSVTYAIRKNDRYENGINLSVVNALARKNDVMYKLKIYDGQFSYARQSFMLTVIPSISYYHKF